MKEIPLTKGYFTQVDDEDFEKFAIYRWNVSLIRGVPRPTRIVYEAGEKPRKVYLYREIMKARKGRYVDHINGDTLDNQKVNLRVCTPSENQANSYGNWNRISKYKGVYPSQTPGKWISFITKRGKRYFLGTYRNEEAAARIYDIKAKELYGEFARPNLS